MLALEIGAYYRMRNGTRVGPVFQLPGTLIFPYAVSVCNDAGFCWTMAFRPNGRYAHDRIESEYDLVERVD